MDNTLFAKENKVLFVLLKNLFFNLFSSKNI